MVATFSSMINVAVRNLDTQPFDYSPRNMYLWLKPKPIQARVPPKEYIGIHVPNNGEDYSFFRPEFGKAVNSYIHVPLRQVGRAFSEAYNIEASVSEFMNNEFSPSIHSARDSLYHVMYSLLRAAAGKYGYRADFEIRGFASGFLERGGIAGVFPVSGEHYLFMKSKDFAENRDRTANKYGVSPESAGLYLLMHEFNHLFGVPGHWEGEQQLEKIIAGLSKHMLQQVYGASTMDDTKRIEMARLLRDIYTIASSREKTALETYGNGNYMRELVSRLTRQALEQGYNTENGIRQYVTREIAKYLKEYNSGGEHKAKDKKATKESKLEARVAREMKKSAQKKSGSKKAGK